MRFVIQCVENAEVEIEGEIAGKIGKGFLVLAGISETDTRETADRMLEKMIKLRIFEDENGKTNLIKAGSPQHAQELYEYLIAKCEQITGHKPQTGQFGALMKVRLTNYGPFTMIMDSAELGY